MCTLLSLANISCNSPPSGHFGNQCKKSTHFVLQDARESCRPTGMLVRSPVEPHRADIPYALVSQHSDKWIWHSCRLDREFADNVPSCFGQWRSFAFAGNYRSSFELIERLAGDKPSVEKGTTSVLQFGPNVHPVVCKTVTCSTQHVCHETHQGKTQPDRLCCCRETRCEAACLGTLRNSRVCPNPGIILPTYSEQHWRKYALMLV